MIFVCADLHFGHGNIAKYCNRFFCMSDFEKETIEAIKERCPNDQGALRQFKLSKETIDKMDSTFIDNINRLVTSSDNLYILGDFAFTKSFDVVKDYRNKINCQHIHFIRGNHDYFSTREYLTIFESVEYYREAKHNHVKFVLCHYPMVTWNNSFRGSIMCHGHCHSNIEGWKKIHMPGLPLIDVGVDEWNYCPVSFDQLIEKAKEIKESVETVKCPDMP